MIRDSFDNKTFNQWFASNVLTEIRRTGIDILNCEEDFPCLISNLKCIIKLLSISTDMLCPILRLCSQSVAHGKLF